MNYSFFCFVVEKLSSLSCLNSRLINNYLSITMHSYM